MTHKTRVIELWGGQDRERERNGRTLWPGRAVEDFTALAGPSAPPFKDAFFHHYKKIRRVVEGYKRPGVAIFAIEGSKLAASACVGAKQKRINVAIIGRHSVADLFLPDDESLSLRHLVVILYPHPKHHRDDLRVRVVDLRTATAFHDERGRRCAALEAEGPLFFSAGRYLFLIFPTGEETPWPDDASAGWDCIPERIYLDDEPAEPDRWRRHRIHGALPKANPTIAPSSRARSDAGRGARSAEDLGSARAEGLNPIATRGGDEDHLEKRGERSDEVPGDEEDTPSAEKDEASAEKDGVSGDEEDTPSEEKDEASEEKSDHAVGDAVGDAPGVAPPSEERAAFDERAALDERDALARALERLPASPAPRQFSPRHRTFVQNISGPSRARRSLLGEDDHALGALRVRSSEGLSTIIVGVRAAREGALFGRYERCDNEGLTVLSNDSISRVHMLLIEIAGKLYVIDTASTNGIRINDQERRVITLSWGKRWMLGDRLAWFEWLKA